MTKTEKKNPWYIIYSDKEFQEKEDEKHWTNFGKPDSKTFEINQKYET